MRFRLRTLLWLFALVAIAYPLSYFYARSEILGKRPKNLTEYGLFRQHYLCATDFKWRPTLVDVADLNACVQRQTSKNFSYQLILESGIEQRRDLWGNYFQWIALDENNQPLPHTQLSKNVGLYSTGPDGVSKSWGNDPDDYNSWNTTEAQYEAIYDQGLSRQFRQRTLQTMPAVFVFLFAAAFIYWNRDKLRSKPRSFYPRDERPWGER